jgi:NAD(P)H dehydrogenase (quinone)
MTRGYIAAIRMQLLENAMYAVTGITGQVGGAVANSLLEMGKKVRAVVRNPERARDWAAKGCEIVQADFADSQTLAGAFTGVEGVFILIPPMFDPSPGFPEVRAVIATLRAALEGARPAKIVCLSTIGAQATQPNLLNQLGLVEQGLSALPFPIAFLRAAWFMENSRWDVASAREGAMPSFLQPIEKAVPMIATADIGRLAAKLLQEDWTGRRIVELESRHRVTPIEMAAAFARILGREVRTEVVARETWHDLFAGQGMKNPTPRIQMLDGFNESWIAFERDGTEYVLGETPFETVAAELVRCAG